LNAEAKAKLQTLARAFAQAVESHLDRELINGQAEIGGKLRELIREYPQSQTFIGALRTLGPKICKVLKAQGIAIASGKDAATIGDTPSVEEVGRLSLRLDEMLGEKRRGYYTLRAEERFPDAINWKSAAGINSMRISGSKDLLILFYPKLELDQEWAKDYANHVPPFWLASRESYARLAVTVKWRCRRFTRWEVQAWASFRADIVELHVLQRMRRTELFEQVLRSTNEGVLVTDAVPGQNFIEFVNAASQAKTGYAIGEMLNRNPRFLQGPNTDPVTTQRIRDAMAKGQPFRGEILNYRKDGTEFWDDLSIAPVKDGEDHVVAFIGIQRDVTETKLQRDDLERARSQLTMAADLARLGFWEYDVESDRFFFDESICRLLNLDERSRKMSTEQVASLFGEDNPFQPTLLVDAAQRAKGASVTREITHRWILDVHAFMLCYRMIESSDGVARRIVGTLQDVSEQRQRESLLAETIERFEAVFDSTSQGIIVTSARGRIESVNQATLEIFGYDVDEDLVGQNISLLVPPEHRARHDGYIDDYLAGKASKIVESGREVGGVSKNGNTKPVHVLINRLEVGGRTRFVAMIRDLSRERELEGQIHRAQRLEALGTLAGGIAHDF
ncbi:MAG: PAS domain S-box protein, partial [Planctomycetes bacterium]|nr:PAS domain S-box protein [Planctomycetota bacterium]